MHGRAAPAYQKNTEICSFLQKPIKKDVHLTDILIRIDMILERFHKNLGHLSIFVIYIAFYLCSVYCVSVKFFQITNPPSVQQNQKKEVLPATTAELYVLICFCIQAGYLNPANSNMTVDAIRGNLPGHNHNHCYIDIEFKKYEMVVICVHTFQRSV